MEWVRQYIIAIVAAAIICSVVRFLSGKESTPASVVRLLTGLLLSVTVIAPLAHINFTDIPDYIDDFSYASDAAIDAGSTFAAEKTSAIIKAKTEAYILDKAQVLGAQVAVEVNLSTEAPYRPCSVMISGKVSPYTKQRLIAFIDQDLGIPEENQIWN